MRVYATLGNPNFVGACLAAIAPLTAALIAESRGSGERGAAATALTIQLLAILATGSRGAALAVVAAALMWTLIRARGRLVVVGAIALPWRCADLSGRSFADTLSGRFHVWQVIAPHGRDHPLVGFGPGSTELRYAGWVREHAAEGTPPPTAADALFQHADNDYLEALVERGIPGLVAVLIVVAAPLLGVVRRGPTRQALTAGAVGAVAAIAAVAMGDEPLARPAELMLLWTAIAIVESQENVC